MNESVDRPTDSHKPQECRGDARYFLKVNCESCPDFAVCTELIREQHSDLIEQRHRAQAFLAKIPEWKASIAAAKQKMREERALGRAAENCIVEPWDEAERKRLKRDEAYARKIASAPAVDESAIWAEAFTRTTLLEETLKQKPLPHWARGMGSGYARYVFAWVARELAKTPDPQRPAGRPRTTKRVAEIFDRELRLPGGTTSPAAIKRMLNVVAKLETEVWTPEAIRSRSQNPVEKLSAPQPHSGGHQEDTEHGDEFEN